MAQEAWGRWGDDDEIGALNLIGPDQVCLAANLVKTGQVINLAQPISGSTPQPTHRSAPSHFMLRDGGDYAAGGRRPGGFQFSEDAILLPLHTGTHVDALCHCWYDDRLYNGHLGNAVRSNGAGRCGIECMPPVVTRGLLLDFCLDGVPARDGTALGVDDVVAALDRIGESLLPGDAVLLRTGWLERQSGSSTDFNAEPGIDVAAARYLAEHGVALVGADNFAVEVLPFAEGTVFPVHQCLIRDFGIPLLEGVSLKPLATAGARAFLFVMAPLAIAGATGSPVTPLAIL